MARSNSRAPGAHGQALSRYASSVQTKASAVEYATRAHIEVSYDQDPVRYQSLSDQLSRTLDRFEQGSNERFEALQKFLVELRAVPEVDETGLDPGLQKPFYNILVEEAGGADDERMAFFKGVTIELTDAIRQELRIVDFWRNVKAQKILRSTIFDLLYEHEIVPYARIDDLVERIVLLARELHERLRA